MVVDVCVCLVGDAVGYILAWCSLLPVFICIVFSTVIAFRRDLFTVSILFCYFADVLIDVQDICALIFLLLFVIQYHGVCNPAYSCACSKPG